MVAKRDGEKTRTIFRHLVISFVVRHIHFSSLCHRTRWFKPHQDMANLSLFEMHWKQAEEISTTMAWHNVAYIRTTTTPK